MQFKRIVIMTVLLLGTWQTMARAAYNFTSTEIDATPVIFTMKDTTSVTFQVKNTSTSPNLDQRIYQVRFRLTGTTGGTVFLNTTTAPTGWTRTAFSTTSITFRANTANDAIVCATAGCAAGPTTSVNFTLKITAGSYSADTNQSLRDVRAYFQNATNPWPPTSSDQRITSTNSAYLGLWTLKSLLMTLVPSVTAVPVGGTFTLTMTVTNMSTSNLTGITSNPVKPTPIYVDLNPPPSVAVSTSSNPASLTLNAGATGTRVWTYTTAGSGPGTVAFQANAVTGTRTSKTVTSVLVSIGVISGGIVVTPACLFTGQTANFTMTVTNNTGGTVNSVTPSTLTGGGTATVGTITPVITAPVNLANGASTQFKWTAPVSGAVLDTYFVTGSATGSGGNTTGSVTSNTEDVDGYIISIDTTDVNLSSTNQTLTWSVVNQACAAIQSVSISFPAGWTWGGTATDSYSLVTNTLGNSVETWTVSGSGPIQFASPSATDRIPLGQGGNFELDFSGTPTSGANSAFTATVTDANGLVTSSLPAPATPVNLNVFNFNSLNEADTESHREDFR